MAACYVATLYETDQHIVEQLAEAAIVPSEQDGGDQPSP